MNINEIKNSMIPRKVKEICWKCESNIHCRNKGCAFRSLGNEYCDEVLLATQEYLEKGQEIKRLNNIIKKAIHFINLNQDEKKLTLNYDDLKKLRGILNNDDYYLTLFEEQLKELKESKKEV